MHSAEDKVARLGCPNGRLDCLEVTQLTDKNNIGVLPQHTPEGLGKTRNIDPD